MPLYIKCIINIAVLMHLTFIKFHCDNFDAKCGKYNSWIVQCACLKPSIKPGNIEHFKTFMSLPTLFPMYYVEKQSMAEKTTSIKDFQRDHHIHV